MDIIDWLQTALIIFLLLIELYKVIEPMYTITFDKNNHSVIGFYITKWQLNRYKARIYGTGNCGKTVFKLYWKKFKDE